MAAHSRVAKPDAAWTRGAKAAAKRALEPLFREMGFSGTFPRYRLAEKTQVKIVAIDVRVRTGLVVELLSLPPGSKSGTWRSEKLRKAVLSIRSTADLPALARKLGAASPGLRREALAFWRASEGHWSRGARASRGADRAERAAVARMMLDGDARKLAAAASRLGAEDFTAALASAEFRYDDEAARRGIWQCATVLIELESPKDEIAASLVVSALDHVGKKTNAKSRALAEKVLAWGRLRLRKNKRLAAQLRHAARARVYDGERASAAALFEFALESKDTAGKIEASAVDMACALYSVLSDKQRLAPERALQERVLTVATKAYPKDRFVQFNAACLSAELGDAAASVKHLLAALRSGIDPKSVITQTELKSAFSDPRVSRALRGVRAPKSGAAASGILPP